MAETIQLSDDGLIDFNIRINGFQIKDLVEILEIGITMELNKITSATLIINDGLSSSTNESFKISNSQDFIPGNEIEIALGYATKTTKVFKGIIVSQRLKVKKNQHQLIVKCKDKAVQLTKGKFNATFQNTTDAEALKKIMAKYSIKSNIEATTVNHNILTQHNCTDWDFLKKRALANNSWIHNYQNKLSISKIDFNASPQFKIEMQTNIIKSDLRLVSENIAESYSMTTWNPDTQKALTNTHTLQDSLMQGNILATKLSKNLSNTSNTYTATSLNNEEIKEVLEAKATRAMLQKINGKITIAGSTKIKAGDIIELSNFGDRFNGKAFISKVKHQLKNGEWSTELVIGLKAKATTTSSSTEITHIGTQIATVKKISEDNPNKYKVLVTLPTYTGIGQEEGIWARMAFPYASDDAGFFFFPEIGDEVLLSFINNDPRFPVIVGAIYSSKNKPKETVNKNNQLKSIHSKTGINIRFDDENKILSLETPNNNTLVLDDKSKSILIKDIHNNEVLMDASGITINSTKDLNLNAEGNINLNAKSDAHIKASGNINVEGLDINQNANASFTAKGNASAELSASGQTTVKGAMVLIN